MTSILSRSPEGMNSFGRQKPFFPSARTGNPTSKRTNWHCSSEGSTQRASNLPPAHVFRISLLSSRFVIRPFSLFQRTPSASERVLEEALSALSRLLERLIRSARLHRESAFLPPCSSSSSSRGGGDSDDQEEPFGDYRDGFSTTSRLCSSGEGLSPHAKAAEDSVRHWQERMPWHQQAALHQEEPQLGHRGSSPGEAAVATLLSFRYPQSGPYTAAGAATAADIYHESRHEAAAKALDLGVADGGLSVCGALFALFLSACPLLGSRGVTGKISTIKSNSGTNGAIGSTRAVGQRADGAGGNGRVEGAGVRVGPSVTPSRVAVLAGEVLKVRKVVLFFVRWVGSA